MCKIIATTRKGNLKKVIKWRISIETAKAYLRENDWFYVDDLGRYYDLSMEVIK